MRVLSRHGAWSDARRRCFYDARVDDELESEGYRRAGWLEVVVLLAISGLVGALIIAVSGPTSLAFGSTHNAVLQPIRSEQLSCDEGVATIGSRRWVATDEALDALRLPLRGRLQIAHRGDAVFEAHGLRVDLVSASASRCRAR